MFERRNIHVEVLSVLFPEPFLTHYLKVVCFVGTSPHRITQTSLVRDSGVDMTSMHTMKIQRASTMMSDVKQLLATGASLNQPNEDGVTLVSPLSAVARDWRLYLYRYRDLIVVSLVLKLHIACASGYREVTSVLLENGSDPQAADGNFWTPLHLAAKYGQVIGSRSEVSQREQMQRSFDWKPSYCFDALALASFMT